MAGFTPSGEKECQKVCFIEAKKKIKKVYNPFKMLRGKCIGMEEDKMEKKYSKSKDVTYKDCRHKCEFMGEHCNAFSWGPNALRLKEWHEYKDLLDSGKQPKEPAVPFDGLCEIFKKTDQCSTFKGDKEDINHECHIRELNIPTYKIQ